MTENYGYGKPIDAWDGGLAFSNLMVEMTESRDIIGRTYRSETVSDTSCESHLGRVRATVSISGVLSYNILPLLISALSLEEVASSANIFPISEQDTNGDYSFILSKGYADGSIDMATGCTLTSFNITTDGTILNFEAIFDAKEILRGYDTSLISGDRAEAVVCPEPILLSDITFDLGSIEIEPLSFDISFTNEIAEDIVNYGSSLKKSACVITKSSGTISFEGLHNDTDVIPYIGEKSLIRMTFGEPRQTLRLSTIVTGVSVPDSEKGVYIKTIDLSIVGNNETPAYYYSAK